MPSFLTDENSPIFSNNHDVLELDPHNQFGLASDADKVNGGSIRHVQSGPINEPFDESSTSSTHDSDVFDAAPTTMNGSGTNGTHLPDMTSHPSTTATYGGGEARNAGLSTNDKPLPNGISTLPDRTVPRQQPHTGANGAEAAYTSPGDMRHTTASGRQSPVDGHQKLPKRSSESAAPHLPTIPSEPEPFSPESRTSSFTPTTPVSESVQHRSTPHRFSSPPVYQSGTSNSGPSSAGHLQPPPGGGLKHRHTLEVPKPVSSRLSRDGMDSATASGRYSPTVSSPMPRRASLSLARRTTRSMQSDMPRDEIVPDEDAARWAEAYRQKRASKRRKKEEEDDERVVVGTKVDEKHANWVTAYNMLTGIRVSVSRTNAKLDRDLTNADFEAKQKSTFDIAGNELVPSAKYDFKFKDYAPWVFRRLRHLFRLDPADYLMSLTGKYILSELGSPGKSGSFFYFSRDYKYIIKTIHHAEHKFLRKTLKEYHHHVTQNPNTLLSQFYGLHRVKMPYGKKIHFVVMNNLFPPHRDIHTTFDLKGSTVGRDYKEDDLADNPRATLKDLNWLRRQRHLELGLQKKRLFLEQLQRDVVLLKRLKIMDYSLLVGVHDLSRGNEENLRDKTLQVFNPGGEKTSEDEPQSILLRTPSKMETVRKARELRQMIRQERPVPMGMATDKMPDELGEGHSRPGFVFTQDDGGFRATHENDDPADEIYYLGVIDCLTHYGMIKKIEHFWKGLSSDKTQISALPPEQYGDRFYNFIEGTTMSPEAAQLDAQQREQEAIEAQQGERSASRTSRRRSTHAIPPMPDHQPPAPPLGPQSPEARETMDRANKEARKSDHDSGKEKQVPDRTLRTNSGEGRDSLQHEPVLPIVEEAGESSRDDRPETPPKDKALPPTRAPPPTPPKPMTHQKLGSGDSGYEGNGNGRPAQRLSKESLRNKSLPPLPRKEETDDSGVRIAA